MSDFIEGMGLDANELRCIANALDVLSNTSDDCQFGGCVEWCWSSDVLQGYLRPIEHGEKEWSFYPAVEVPSNARLKRFTDQITQKENQ